MPTLSHKLERALGSDVRAAELCTAVEEGGRSAIAALTTRTWNQVLAAVDTIIDAGQGEE